MNTQPAFIMTGDGNITLILGNKNFSIGTSHRNYALIVEALKNKTYGGLEALIDVSKTIVQKMTVASGNKVIVNNGQVLYGNLPMDNTVTDRILDFIDQGLPAEPLVRFLENLMANPMPMAVSELYDFLENTHNGRPQFPITEDGCFIGYKGVNDDFTDRHTSTVDNSVGKIIEMPREAVDPDRRNECSYGYHVGTIDYARSFGSRLLMVKVNPADCVAVPKDHNCSKLRVCKYEVLSVCDTVLDTPMYPMPEVIHDDGPEPEEYDIDDDFEEEDSDIPPTANTMSVGPVHMGTLVLPKRAPCGYCGARGGKRHAPRCDRP